MPCESFGGGVSTHIYRIRKNFQISQLWCIIRVSKNQVCRAHFGKSQKLRRAGGEGRAPSKAWGRFAPIPSFQEIPGIGKGQGRWGNMGRAPIPPTLGMINGAVRRQILCGRHIMREHSPAGKLAGGFASGADRFYRPAIRVCPPQERQIPPAPKTVPIMGYGVKPHVNQCPSRTTRESIRLWENRLAQRVRKQQSLPFYQSGAPSAGESICPLTNESTHRVRN